MLLTWSYVGIKRNRMWLPELVLMLLVKSGARSCRREM
nr:MAG TPA: hypothetical protein [Caudoviricetes sp.]